MKRMFDEPIGFLVVEVRLPLNIFAGVAVIAEAINADAFVVEFHVAFPASNMCMTNGPLSNVVTHFASGATSWPVPYR